VSDNDVGDVLKSAMVGADERRIDGRIDEQLTHPVCIRPGLRHVERQIAGEPFVHLHDQRRQRIQPTEPGIFEHQAQRGMSPDDWAVCALVATAFRIEQRLVEIEECVPERPHARHGQRTLDHHRLRFVREHASYYSTCCGGVRPAAILRPVLSPARSLVILALLTVLQTWPLSIAPATRSLNHNADAQTFEWTLSWIAHALATHPTHLFDGNVFAPEPRVLAFADPLLVPGLLGAPLRWLGASPVLTFNLVQVAGLLLTAWAGWFVVWRWTGSASAALTSGALAAFNVHLLARLPHVQAAHAWGLPLTLYFADALMAQPSRRGGVRLALIIAAVAATSLYTLAFAGVIVGVVVVVGIRKWQGVLAVVASSLAGLVAAAPVLWPYALLGRAGLSRPLDMVAEFSATPAAYVQGISHADAWLTGATSRDELQLLFAGVTALALAGIGIVAAARLERLRVRLTVVMLVAGVAVLFSLGPATPVYRWLYDWIPPLRGLRAVSRFGYLYLMAVAVLAGVGVAWLERRMPGRRILVAVAALAAVSLEAWSGPVRTEPFTRVPPVYSILADDSHPVMLVEVPFFPPDGIWGNGEYMLNATAHWRPVMNGYSGFTPDSYRRRAESFWFFPRDWAIDAIVREGATHVMVHLERLDERERADIVATLPLRHDLSLIASDALGHRLYEVRRPQAAPR